jgi:pimeloyl-ACP methyl ester carboxylesterase
VVVLVVAVVLAWTAYRLTAPPGPVEMTDHHPFRSPAAKQRYLERYDRRGAIWPGPSETRMIETSFGSTFVRINGPEGAAPLVILPGANATSLIWAPNIAELSRGHRTFAVDNIYDFGRSVFTRHVRTPADFVQWLDELLDGLELGGDVSLMGLSYGGWIASQYALHSPERLRAVVLVAPAATVQPLNPEFLKRAVLCLIPHRRFLDDLMHWVLEDAVNGDDSMRRQVEELVEDNYLGLRSFEFKQLVNPTVLSDAELQSFEVPVLFLVGEHEKIYSADAAVSRLRTVAPAIEVVLVPDAGHDLTLVQTGLVNRTVVEFLEQVRSAMGQPDAGGPGVGHGRA